MSKAHTPIVFVVTTFLLLKDVTVSLLKPALMAYCLFLLHLRKAIPVIAGFLETSAEGICDLLVMLASFALSLLEGPRDAESESTPKSVKKFSNIIEEAEEEILRNLDEPNMGFSEQEAESASSKHRFSSTFQHYFSKRDREGLPRI